MKKHIILTAGFVIVTAAAIVASQSINQGKGKAVQTIEVKTLKPDRLYTSDDVEYLMHANHWSRPYAIQVLELASKAAESKNTLDQEM